MFQSGPFGARQMALERPSGAIGLMFRVKMQHDPRDFTPVSPFRIRVEQAQICDEVLLVVNGQYGIGGRGIGDIGIKRRFLHRAFSRQVADRASLLWTPWHIVTPYQRSPLYSK